MSHCCVSGNVCYAKTAEPIEMPFGMETRVGPTKAGGYCLVTQAWKQTSGDPSGQRQTTI